MENVQNILYVSVGVLMSLSELLPFFEQVESNGIVHFFYCLGKSYFKKIGTETERTPILDNVESTTT
jgi:hypothetical protein